MIIALVLSMIGMITTFAYMCDIVTQYWIFIVGQSISVAGLLVAADIWDDVKERIKKLELKK